MNKKNKFNVLDFVIIIFSLLSLFSIIFWEDIRINFLYEEKNIEYSFIARGVTKEEFNSLVVGDEIFFSADEKDAGRLTSFSGEKETLPVVLVDGSVKKYEADTYTVSGSVVANGIEKENGIYIEDEYFMVPGKKFNVETSKISIEIEIVDLIIR